MQPTITDTREISNFIELLLFFNPHPRIWSFNKEREGGKERGRERERERLRNRNVSQLPPTHALTRDQTCNPGTCLDQGSNPQPFGVWNDAATN